MRWKICIENAVATKIVYLSIRIIIIYHMFIFMLLLNGIIIFTKNGFLYTIFLFTISFRKNFWIYALRNEIYKMS